jgi:carbon starvation protein
MPPVVAAIAAFVLYFVFFRFYAKFLGKRIFRLDPDAITPAHSLEDGVDYVPSKKGVLFGHHFASIAGLAPMLGPALAVIWGWLPAMLWVVFGSVLIGAVHDFSAIVVSMRHRGLSIGKIAENLIGKRAKALFLLIILFLICLVMGVFIGTVADLFTTAYYPQSVFPTFFLMGVAMVIGWRIYKRSASLGPSTVVGFALQLISIYVALEILGQPDFTRNTWIMILLVYAFAASVLPVWILLQPRDYLNSLLLYLGLAAAYIGFFVLRPEFVAPAVNVNPDGAPPIFPFVFIVIACSAASGFHGLVSSGTTSKQIDKEPDAVTIGYGAMIGESTLGLLAVLATTAGFASAGSWSDHYMSWDAASGLGDTMSAFINGAALFVSQLGVPMEIAQSFIALVAVSFALTTVDSGTRLLRYNIGEIADSIGIPQAGNRYVASLIAVGFISFFAFFQVDGQAAGSILWVLFGSTNQVLAGLTLLTVTVYLRQKGWNYWYTFVPMVFMLIVTIIAMVYNLSIYVGGGQWLLTVVASAIFVLSVWLVIEAIIRFSVDTKSLPRKLEKSEKTA